MPETKPKPNTKLDAACWQIVGILDCSVSPSQWLELRRILEEVSNVEVIKSTRPPFFLEDGE